MSGSIDELRELITSVAIENVRQVSGQFGTRIGPEQLEPAGLDVTYGSRATREGPVLLVYVRLTADVTPSEGSGDKPEPLSRFRATFEARYTVPEGLAISDETLKAFADANGIFNVWPYWREFVHASSTRTGLPSVVMPVYRIGASPPTAAGLEDDSEGRD